VQANGGNSSFGDDDKSVSHVRSIVDAEVIIFNRSKFPFSVGDVMGGLLLLLVAPTMGGSSLLLLRGGSTMAGFGFRWYFLGSLVVVVSFLMGIASTPPEDLEENSVAAN
jgi:hypothetical protein